MTRSRVSFAHVTSFGKSSIRSRCVVHEELPTKEVDLIWMISKGVYTERVGCSDAPAIIFATVAFGRDRSSSGGGPECPSRSDIAQPQNKYGYIRGNDTVTRGGGNGRAFAAEKRAGKVYISLCRTGQLQSPHAHGRTWTSSSPRTFVLRRPSCLPCVFSFWFSLLYF